MSPASRFKMPMPGDPLHEEPFPLGAGVEALRAPEPFRKLVEVREEPCGKCGRVCRYSASARVAPESPEFLQGAPDVWLGFAIHPVSETLAVVAACSEECMRRLLEE